MIHQIKLVVIILFLGTQYTFAQPNDSDPIEFLSLSDLSESITEEEINNLKETFDNSKVINLEKSDLPGLGSWVNELNTRLTLAAEKLGEFYPSQKILLLLDEKPMASVYKYNPSGYKFYRSYIFLSTGFIQQLVGSLAEDISKLDSTQLDRLLKAIQGVVAHESAHPKQDELIKWGIRKANNHSRFNHGQADELTTDLIGIKLLREAKLDSKSMLEALSLLEIESDGYHPIIKSIKKGVSTHPDTELRINTIRGALTHLRMNEGKQDIQDIPYDEEAIKKELVSLLEREKPINRVRARQVKDSSDYFSALINTLRVSHNNMINEWREIDWDEFAKHLKLRDLLMDVDLKKLTEENIKMFIKYSNDLHEKLGDHFLTQVWYKYSHSGSGGKEGLRFNYNNARTFQYQNSNIELFKHPAYLEWYQKQFLEKPIWDVLKNINIDNLGVILPPDLLHPLLKEAVSEMSKLIMPNDAKQLFRLLLSGIYADFPAELEFKIVDEINKHIIGTEGFVERIEPYINNIEEGFARGITKRIRNARLVKLSEKSLGSVKKLTLSYSNLAKNLLQHPQLTVFYSHLHTFNSYSESRGSFMHNYLFWEQFPEQFPKGLNKHNFIFSDRFFDKFLENFTTEVWKSEVRKVVSDVRAGAVAKEIKTPLKYYLKMYDSDYFTVNERAKQFEKFLNQNQIGYNYENKKIIKAMLDIVGNSDMYIHAVKKFSQHGVQGEQLASVVNQYLAEVTITEHIIKGIAYLKNEDVISEELFNELLNKRTYLGEKGAYESRKHTRMIEANQTLKKYASERKVKGVNFLEQVLGVYDLGRITEEEMSMIGGWAREKDKIRAVIDTKTRFESQYAYAFAKVKNTILGDLKEELGLDRRVADQKLKEVFVNHYDRILKYYKTIFNPDNVSLNKRYRKILNYKGLDPLFETFIAIIPEDLELVKKNELWLLLTSKRSNTTTDNYFRVNLLESLIENKDITQYYNTLNNARVKSDQINLALLREIQNDKFRQLKETAGKRLITDRELNDFLQEIYRFTNGSSRFRDEYLDKISWDFQLTRKQLEIFVEPARTLNFKAFDQDMLRVLSAATELVTVIKPKDKIKLIKYIQKPVGGLVDENPAITLFLNDAKKHKLGIDIDHYKLLFDRLETFIKDASVEEKMLLIEGLVGTRRTGLWHLSEEMRAELLLVAGLEGKDRDLFHYYIQSLPEHEHSIVMSYLLASYNEYGKPDILAIMEMFQTPGVKFAQLSSIYSLFGEENSKKLSKAKNNAKPTTKLEILRILEKEFPVVDLARTKLEKSLGSGGIKFVVRLLHDDGTRSALFIRRPFIENTNDDIIEVAKKWIENVKNDPQFKDEFDFNYYLESLREQLEKEEKFSLEADYSDIMADKYESVKKYKGWRYKGIRPQRERFHNNEVFHYDLVSNAVPFDELSPGDKKVVSEYILKTELKFIFTEGDADRHLGNYLIDPVKKTIYPIDMGQYYRFEKTGILTKSKGYYMAKLLEGISHESVEKGSSIIHEVFISIAQNDVSQVHKKLKVDILNIMNSDKNMNQKIISLMSSLNRNRVQIPSSVSLGFVKAISILLNEDYSKEVSQSFIKNELKKNIKKVYLRNIGAITVSKIKSATDCFKIYMK